LLTDLFAAGQGCARQDQDGVDDPRHRTNVIGGLFEAMGERQG
jgi:hypothetical protein